MATSASSKKSTVASATMPKKPLRRGKVPCGVCQGAITEGKDEALLCEGECGLWLHRGCASVPPSLYKALANSDDPFICLCCSNAILKREIVLLKKELENMAEVRERCAMLTTEVSSLRKAVENLSAQSSSTTRVGAKPTRDRTYAGAVRSRAPQAPSSQMPDHGVLSSTPIVYHLRPVPTLTAYKCIRLMSHRGAMVLLQVNKIGPEKR